MPNTPPLEQNDNRDNLSSPSKAIKTAIVGLPNTGKSLVFNNLTGKYALVANYPLTTVEMKRACCRIHGELYEMIDTPGLRCLCIHSEEELVVRDMLFSEKPDILIQCINANQLKQSLALTIDLLELGIPMIISLNAVDETKKKGIWIDSTGLSCHVGVPVIESNAMSGLGTDQLKRALPKARLGKWHVTYGDIIEGRLPIIASVIPEEVQYRKKAAALLLLDDPFFAKGLTQKYGPKIMDPLTEEVKRTKEQLRANIGIIINNKRNRWVDAVVENVIKRQRTTPGTFSKGLGRLSRHPVFGIPILLLVIFVMYFLVVNVANGICAQLKPPS